MRSSTHLLTGLATVACIPGIAADTAHGELLPMLSAALGSVLPDFIDFAICRCISRPDVTIAPDPLNINPGETVQAVSEAIDLTKRRKSVTLSFNPLPIDHNRWRSYQICFERIPARVKLRFGSILNNEGCVIAEADMPRWKSAGIYAPVRLDSTQETTISGSSGASMEIYRDRNNRLRGKFYPWRRNWSHGLPLWTVISLVAGIFAPRPAFCFFIAALMHIIIDQGGQMGSALFAPLHKTRIPGWRMWSYGSKAANSTACLLALSVLMIRFTGPTGDSIDPFRVILCTSAFILFLHHCREGTIRGSAEL